jgi:hypothetical protein
MKNGKRVLLPIAMCNVRGKKGVVEVSSITGAIQRCADLGQL